MNRIVFSLVVAVFATQGVSALAADLGSAQPYNKAPAAVVVVQGWNGFYAGLNVGAGISRSSYTVSPADCFVIPFGLVGSCDTSPSSNALRVESGNLNKAGFVGGGQLGYDRQFGRWLAGLVTDLDYNDVSQALTVTHAMTAPLTGTVTYNMSERMQWFGTFRGRIGYVPINPLLLYVTGGLAYGHASATYGSTYSPFGDSYLSSRSATRVGWTAGAGGEYKLGGHWSATLEYLYLDLGTLSFHVDCANALACIPPPPGGYQNDTKLREHIARVGFNYRWDD